MAKSRRPREDNDEYNKTRTLKKTRICPNEEIEERLTSLIINIDSKSLSLESSIEELALVLEADLNIYGSKIINIISECAIKFPAKSTIYSTLVGILNVKNIECGDKLVKRMELMFNDTFNACKWEEARYILRFLANLVNCNVVSARSFYRLLHNLIDEANDITGTKDCRDWFVYCVLSTLPWVGKELYEKLKIELKTLLQLIEIYMGKRPKNIHQILRVWTTNTPHPQEEYLNVLWFQICNLQSKNWCEKCIVRPYLAFDSILCKNMRHNLSLINLSPHDDTCKFPMPSVVFRMFDNTDCLVNQATMPDALSIERFLIEDDLHSILNWHKLDRKNCGSTLLNLPYKKKFPLEYCIIEVIFGEYFHLPTSQCSEIACGSILIELCKLQPLTVPQILAQSANLLFMRIDTMKVACVDRFIDWFSFHLSNFQFKWNWDNWTDCLVLDAEHPKPKFIKELIIKCMRLSYHKRISDILPETFKRFIPVEPESDFKYLKDEAGALPETSAAHKLVVSIRKSTNIGEILDILKDIKSTELDEVESRCTALQIGVFVQTLLHLGSQSYSHSVQLISKFFPVFKFLAKSEEEQICILQNMFELWHNNQQMMIRIVDKLLKIKVVECSSVAIWIFSNEMKLELTKMYLWEILRFTIRTMNKYIAKLRKDLSEAIKKSDSEEELERVQQKVEIAEDDFKNLFLITFQRFTMILSEHLSECEKNECDYNTYWYKAIVGRMEQVLLEQHVQVHEFISKMDALIFTKNLDSRILDTYQQFVSLLI